MKTLFKAIHAARLLILADFLADLKPEEFNIGTWSASEKPAVRGCGMAACAGGWAPVVLPTIFYADSYGGPVHKESHLYGFLGLAQGFGLTLKESSFFFSPGSYTGKRYEHRPTAQQVANRMRRFIKRQGFHA